jgi:hypothetical protein
MTVGSTEKKLRAVGCLGSWQPAQDLFIPRYLFFDIDLSKCSILISLPEIVYVAMQQKGLTWRLLILKVRGLLDRYQDRLDG